MEMNKSRSVVVEKFGGYNSLKVKDYTLPDVEELVEVEVAFGGLNFADLYTRQGLMPNKKLPYVSGIECSGTIRAVGTKVTNKDLKLGQKVICYNFNGGMFGDVIRVEPSDCFLVPNCIDLKTASATFVNYLTAYFGLLELGHLQDNEDILILSCTGGVGIAATQLAKTKNNVKVFGTGSKQKKEEALKNGVDVFFQNETFELEANQCKFDVILTNQSGSLFNYLQGLLKPLGRIVILGASEVIKDDKKVSPLTLLKLWWSTKSISPYSLIINNRVVSGLHLGALLEHQEEKVKKVVEKIFVLIQEGNLNPVIDSVWPMEEVIEATKRLGERKNVGKVLIQMKKCENESRV